MNQIARVFGRSHQWSRRTFLERFSAIATVASSVRPRLLTAGVFAGGDERIRVGLIGCGGRGTGAALQAAAADPSVRIVAMGDLFADQIDSSASLLARAAGIQFECPPERRFLGFNAYRDVLDAGVDIVLLTSPPHMRPLHVTAAIEAGKHLYCEKPVAIDVAGVHEVATACAVARQRMLSIVSGFCFRHDEPTVETMRRIHDGAIGRVIGGHCHASIGLPWRKAPQRAWSQEEWQQRNWISFERFSGGHFVEHHSHAIDRAIWARGDACPVTAVPCDAPAFGGGLRGTGVRYEFADGGWLNASCERAMRPFTQRIETVIAADGSCDLLRHKISGSRPWQYGFDGSGWSRKKPAGMYQAGMDALLQAVRSGVVADESTRMCRSTLVAILGRTALSTGQRVDWQENQAEPEALASARPLSRLA